MWAQRGLGGVLSDSLQPNRSHLLLYWGPHRQQVARHSAQASQLLAMLILFFKYVVRIVSHRSIPMTA